MFDYIEEYLKKYIGELSYLNVYLNKHAFDRQIWEKLYEYYYSHKPIYENFYITSFEMVGYCRVIIRIHEMEEITTAEDMLRMDHRHYIQRQQVDIYKTKDNPPVYKIIPSWFVEKSRW